VNGGINVRRWLLVLLTGALTSCGGASARPGSVHDGLPDPIDPDARYVIYLHGRIIEDGDRRPTHPQWGTYEFEQVLDALTAEGAVVIGEQRPPSADMELFAHHVAGQVEQLLRAGVPPERVAVVGFSKGGGIAMRASALLENPRVTMVLLAACGDGDFSTSDIRVWGRVLSVYEASDDSGRSCGSLFAKSEATGVHSEIEIVTGEEHGAFYRPNPQWVTPVLEWIRD
jgi:hypothetical protein